LDIQTVWLRLAKSQRKKGGGVSPHPSLAVPRLVVPEVDDEVVDVPPLDRSGEPVEDARVDTLGEFEPLALDRVREVLRHGVVEVEQVTLAVLGVSRTLPDPLDALTHPLGHDLGLLETEQDAVTLFLRHSGLNHPIEQRGGLLESHNRTTKRLPHDVGVKGSRVLTGHPNSRHGDGKPVRANEADKPDLEGGTEGAVKGVLNLEAEGNVVAVRKAEAVVGEVVDRTDASPAPRADGLPLEVAEALRLEEPLGFAEEVGVLEEFVAVRDHAQDLLRVRADIGEVAGAVAVGQVHSNLFNSIVKLFGLTLGDFGDDVVVHFVFCGG